MADNTVLKHFQIFRNKPGDVVPAISHAAAVTAAETKFATLTGLKDGELVLYRYKLNDETTIHTLVGVHYISSEGTGSTYEILGNYDQLSAEYKAYVDSAIEDLADVAHSGAAADVTVAAKTDAQGNTVVAEGTVQGTLESIAAEIDAMDSTYTLGTLVNVNFAQVDGKVTTFTTDETALEARLTAIEDKSIIGKKAIVVTSEATTGNNEVSLKLAEETILTQNGDGLKATLSIVYNSNDKQIELHGVNGVIGEPIDATDFIKDGMLEDAEIITATNEDGLVSGKRYIKFTFKTYQQGQEGAEVLKVEYLDVENLFDSYTSGNDWIVINQTTNEISHAEVGAAGTYAVNDANITVDSTNEKSFNVPTLTVDAAGHVTAASEKTVTIKLPASINTAIQKVEKAEGEKYLNVTKLEGSNDVTISTITGSVSYNDDKLAVASDVKTYVDGKIGALDTPEVGVSSAETNNVKVTVKQVDGIVNSVEVVDNSVNATDVSNAITTAIAALDTPEVGVSSAETNNVKVTVTQVDGIVNTVTVVDNSVNAEDVNTAITTAIEGLVSEKVDTNVKGDITVKVSQENGVLNSVEVTDTLAEVAHSGKAANVAIDDEDDLYTTTNVESALAEVMAKANALDAAQLSAGNGINITENKINSNFVVTIETRTEGEFIVIKGAGENGTEITSVNANAFVKDGMLKSAELNGTDLVLTWNTDGDPNADGTNGDVVRIPLNSLVDVYTAKENDWIQLNDFEFSHKTQSAFTQVEGQDAPQTTFGANAADVTVNNTESKSFNVPTLTVDAAGHVTAASEKTVTITLPGEIDTAVQTVTSTEEVNATNKFVVVKATRAEGSNDVVLKTVYQTKDVEGATTDDNGLATAHSVKTYVEGKIANVNTAIADLDATLTPDTTINTETANVIKVSLKQKDGLIKDLALEVSDTWDAGEY